MAKVRPPQFDRSAEAAERYRVQLETHRDARTRYTATRCRKATRKVIQRCFNVLPAWVPLLTKTDREALIEDIGWQTVQACRGRDYAIGFRLDWVSWNRVQFEHELAIYHAAKHVATDYLRFYADFWRSLADSTR